MSKITKFIITGDFLRMNAKGAYCQDVNIRWLYHLLRPIFAILVPEFKTKIVTSLPGPSSRLAEQFYWAAGEDPSLEAWARCYCRDANRRQLALLEASFGSSLVVSFELPDLIAKGFNILGIPYLDFTIHPARFMRGLAFGCRSNRPELRSCMDAWILREEQIYQEGGIAMAAASRLPRVKICEQYSNIAIFACQTSQDRSLMRNGEFVRIEEFEDEIRAMLNTHELVLVKPHPYEKGSNAEMYLTHALAGARLINTNIYHLLSHDSVRAVYSLSSSASIESRYLDKDGIHFAEYPYYFTETPCGSGEWLAVNGCLAELPFWQRVFEKLNLPVQRKEFPLVNLDYRRSLNAWWGADVLYK